MKDVDIFRDMTVAELNALGPSGRAALSAEAEAMRIGEVRARGDVPDVVGEDCVAAPARGVFQVVEMQALYPDGETDYALKPSGYAGRKTIKMADVWESMAVQAARRGKPMGVTRAQVQIARDYRDTHERWVSAGMQCSSIEARVSGGSRNGGGFMDAFQTERENLDRWRRLIGTGAALRRVRPSKARPNGALLITDRQLVDAMCLEDLDLGAVLKKHGWSVYGGSLKAARKALTEALDRMMEPLGRARTLSQHWP